MEIIVNKAVNIYEFGSLFESQKSDNSCQPLEITLIAAKTMSVAIETFIKSYSHCEELTDFKLIDTLKGLACIAIKKEDFDIGMTKMYEFNFSFKNSPEVLDTIYILASDSMQAFRYIRL